MAVILLDRLVDDGGRIVGRARLLEERVEHAEIGRDEIVGALRRHRDEGGRAGLRRRQIFGDQGSQRVRALGRGRPVGGPDRKHP